MKQKIYPIVYPNSLRSHRKAAGLRQREIADALGLISTDRISRWEHGSAEPNIDNLFKLLVLYRATPAELYPDKWQAIVNLPSVSEKETSLPGAMTI
jgi:transcriptional regulator with XRE-family HTH domain